MRERTLSTYRRGTTKLAQWCTSQGVRGADALTLAHLVSFRSWLSAEPRQRQAAGGKRGTRTGTRTGAPRAPSAVNVEIRSVKAALTYLRRVGLLPRLSRDDLSDGLKLLPTPRAATNFFRPPEIQALLEAARAHDAVTFEATREEHAGLKPQGSTARYAAITPLVLVALLSGMRFGELAALDCAEVDLAADEIRLGTRTKTKHARTVSFEHSPLLAATLAAAMPASGKGPVWALTIEQMRAGAKRLKAYGAPEAFTWQGLRRTCGTYLTNAPGIFGAASAYRSARQLGHSVAIAERHYLGVVKVPKEAATLEAAMGIDALAAVIVG